MTEAFAQTEPASIARRMAAALLPGLDPLMRRQWSLAVLFLFGNLWVRLMIAGQAPDAADRVSAFLFGAFGIGGGVGRPALVFLSACVVAVHVLAWRDAGGARGRNRH